MPNKIEVPKMVVDKVTKHKIRYREPEILGEEDSFGTFPVLYIRKEALIAAGMAGPGSIRVTIEQVED